MNFLKKIYLYFLIILFNKKLKNKILKKSSYYIEIKWKKIHINKIIIKNLKKINTIMIIKNSNNKNTNMNHKNNNMNNLKKFQ